MSTVDTLARVLMVGSSAAFAWLGYKHAKINSYWIEADEKDAALLRRYYRVLAVFAASVTAYGLVYGREAWINVPWVTGFVATVHVIRFYTDWLDLKERPEPIDLRRPIADFAANLFTIFLALFVFASRDPILGLVAAFFGLMFVAKEMYFRMKVDVFRRPRGTRNTTQGGGGAETDPRLRPFQTFLGRFLKSYFYIVVGLSILYLMIPVLFPSTPDFVSKFGSGQNGVVDTFWFTLACLTQFPAGLPLVVMPVIVLEFGANATIVLFLLYLAFTNLAADRAR